MTDDGVRHRKAALRQEALERRRRRDGTERRTTAHALAAHLRRASRDRGWRRVCAYAPLATEPGDPELPMGLVAYGVEVLLPVVTADLDLDWARFGPGTPLAVGRAGATEPASGHLGVDAVRGVDAVIVPSLLVDGGGTRLGRGAGSYDRALARAAGAARPGTGTPPDLVAVVFDDEVVTMLPMEDHDVRVTWVLTPGSGLRPTSASLDDAGTPGAPRSGA